VFYGNLGQHVGLYCPKNPNRQRAYHCCYCKFRSIDRATLLEHKATHVLARDFKCEICDSSFFTRQRLVRHMRYVHLLGTNPVRIYTCDRCGKRFRYHSHYDRHLTIHSGMLFILVYFYLYAGQYNKYKYVLLATVDRIAGWQPVDVAVGAGQILCVHSPDGNFCRPQTYNTSYHTKC